MRTFENWYQRVRRSETGKERFVKLKPEPSRAMPWAVLAQSIRQPAANGRGDRSSQGTVPYQPPPSTENP